MKLASIILLFGFVSIINACTYPSRTIEQGGTLLTGIYFEGAPAGARLVLDGADAGEAAAFDGSAAILAVSPGTHNVVVTAGDREIYNEQVYVGSGSRVSIGVQ